MAALPGGEPPPHPLPGRLVPALVFPDERGLARLQLNVKRSLLLEECGLPARMAARMAALSLQGRGKNSPLAARQVNSHHTFGTGEADEDQSDGGRRALSARPLRCSRASGRGIHLLSTTPGRAAVGRVLEQITMLCRASLSSWRSAGFQPAWRPGWPPSQAGSPPPSLAAWCQPLSFPTSADGHGYNLS